MDASSQALQQHAEVIECWDDDPDFANLDAIQQQCSSSPSHSVVSTDRRRRESVSSRMSIQSAGDFDDAEGKQHHVALDETSASAISSAISAGIPIPEDTPPSALVGGSISRLGSSSNGRKVTTHDDWSEDLELPTVGSALTVRKQKEEFPASLQHVPAEHQPALRIDLASALNASSQLNKYRDGPEDEDCFIDDDDRSGLQLSPGKRPLNSKMSTASLLTTPPLSESPTRTSTSIDDFEKDFEFPADAPLSLSVKPGELTKPPLVHGIDTGLEEWGDNGNNPVARYPTPSQKDQGSVDGKTDSVVVSPSSLTAESEDEAPFDGLELPSGSIPDFHALLEKRRQAAVSPMDTAPDFQVQKDTRDGKEEFFDGIEIGDGEVFDSKKLTFNRNVKHKQVQRKTSPIRRSTTSLTFTTNKSAVNQPPGRLNRLGHNHPALLPPLPILESVEERENHPTIKKRTDHRSKLSGGQADHQRWASKDTPGVTIPPPPPPPIPHSDVENQRVAGVRSASRTMRRDSNPVPTTTSAQLLRAKRSMPNIAQVAGNQSPGKSARPPSRNTVQRPPSRNSAGTPTGGSRSNSSTGGMPPGSGRPSSRTSTGRPASRNDCSRPKTPHNGLPYKHPAPFLPAGTSNSHHIAAKTSRQSLAESERRSNSRVQFRSTPRHSPSSSGASNATQKNNRTPTVAPEHLRREAAAIGQLTQPTRKRNFGDGTELETFDDLPTSVKAETKYTVNPVTRGYSRITRRNSVPPPRRAENPQKRVDMGRNGDVPRFARDTNASRNARAQTLSRLGMNTPDLTSPPSPEQVRKTSGSRASGTPRTSRKRPQKPHLIKPLGNISNLPKANNGMTYNPRTYTWEGNEKDLRSFDMVETPTTPRPALITNVNQSGPRLGVQVVGGMVFDPTLMCWLRVNEDPDEEPDPFEGLEDLVEHDMMSIDGSAGSSIAPGNNSILMGPVTCGIGAGGGLTRPGGSCISGEFVVGEEFDVGPMFEQRQREEEDQWRKTVEGWISPDLVARPDTRYALRALLTEHERKQTVG